MALKDQLGRLLADHYPIRFSTRILYADMDAFRHLNNGATGRYFEEGRAECNTRVFGSAVMTDPPAGLQLLFANVVIDFLAQAHYPGHVEVATGISRIGNSSWTVVQATFQHDRCFALADAVMVKAVHGRPQPLTDEERGAMAALMLPTRD